MLGQMTPKERILAAIDHKPVDKIPTDYWGTPEATHKLMKGLGIYDYMELWRTLDVDIIATIETDYIGPMLKKEDGIISDYWGVDYKAVSYGNNEGVYHEVNRNPIKNFETIDEIEAGYIWPKAEWFDFSGIEEKCIKYPDHAIACGYISPFYMYSNIRGLEQSLIDMAADEEMADYILDRTCDFLYDYHKRIFEAGGGRINIAQVTDDFGTQNGLMISVDMFDRFFMKHFQRFAKLLKEFDIKVFHHDDGAIMPLIPRLVEVGIDILNPLQWRLPGMDLKELKNRFGKDICFHGGIDNQYVLPFGTVEEVREEVAVCLETLASDGTGYILAPCHNVQVISLVENIVAMYETAKELGRRR